MGSGIHRPKATVRDKFGTLVNSDVEVVNGCSGSLISALLHLQMVVKLT